MTVSLPTLIISRRPREIGSSWDDARSWFGGRPQLGEQPWPRGAARQTPFYFLAQIDLAKAVRSLINSQYLLPTHAWHQMFGRGVDIQGNAAYENEGNVLLLQLVYDDMMHWQFGDNGAFQFWISPDDLAGGNWAAVRVTFECH